MILKEADIKKILLERPNKKLIDEASKYTRKLMMHMTGVGLKEYIQRIDHFERPGAQEIRLKYTASNKDLFSRIHRPIDKVFNARGGSSYYNLPEAQTKKFRQILSNVEYGYSIRKWMEAFWRPAYHYDPMGMIFIEIDQNGEAYPTYKSIIDVYDYQPNGRQLDYIIFKTDQKIERVRNGKKVQRPVYRIVDDAFDYLVEWDGVNYRTIQKETFANFFGQVPAIIISDIFDPLRGFYISPDDDIIEKADEFLREGSVKSIFKNYFGFPQAWRYSSDCPTCQGEGIFEGRKCPDCHGQRVNSKREPWEAIEVPIPESNDHKLAPDLAGYVSPDIEGWGKMTEELQLLEDIMDRTYWGTQRVEEDKKNETATGRFVDVQPVNERLNKFSDAAEYVEDYVTDLLGQFYFGKGYKGASINYGRRFLIETPDEIWLKYQNARKSGAPNSVLDNLLIDFYQTKYQSDSVEMQRYLKLMRVEPFVHLTAIDLNAITIPKLDYLKKLYFNEWLAITPDSDILLKPVAALQESLTQYVTPKMALEDNQPAGVPPAPGDPDARRQVRTAVPVN